MTVTIENTNVDTVLNIAELTTASLTGTGVFDVLLQTLRLHLDREFTSGRITGTAYATVYSQALTAVLQQSVGFCLSKTKLALELQQMQEQVVLLQKQQDQITATIRQTDYITDYQLPADLATKNKQLALLDYDLVNIKPVELAIAQQDILLKTAQAALTSYDLTTIKPQELALLTQKVANETYVVQHRLPAEVADIEAGVALKDYELTDIKPIQKAQIQAETSHIGKQELGTIQQTRNLESQQAQIEATTDRLIYETTTKLPEEVQLIKLNQDQLIAQNNKIATDTVVTIKQGHLTDAQTCQVTAQTNQVNAEVALKLPEEVELVKRNQTMLTSQIAEINYRTTTLMPSQTAQTTAQTAQVTYTTANLIPKQVLQLQSQVAQTDAQTAQVTYTTSNILPAQLALTTSQKESSDAQTALYEQKVVTETAQTTSTPAAGSVMGVQNALMVQQTENYLRDAEQKAAKIMIETWSVRQNTDGADTATNHLADSYIATAVDALLAGIT